MANTVGTEGQVVIEEEIRDALGIEPGWTAIQQLVDGHVQIYFIPPPHNESLAGILAPYTDVRIPDEDALHEASESLFGANCRHRNRHLRRRVDHHGDGWTSAPRRPSRMSYGGAFSGRHSRRARSKYWTVIPLTTNSSEIG